MSQFRIVNANDYQCEQPVALIYSSWMQTHCRSRQARDVFAVSASRALSRYDMVAASVDRTFATGALYFLLERSLISRLIQDPSTTWLYAVDAEDESNVYGWLCASGEVLHYVFVKPHMHRCGIASALLRFAFQPGIVSVSHWTSDFAMMKVDGYKFEGE